MTTFDFRREYAELASAQNALNEARDMLEERVLLARARAAREPGVKHLGDAAQKAIIDAAAVADPDVIHCRQRVLRWSASVTRVHATIKAEQASLHQTEAVLATADAAADIEDVGRLEWRGGRWRDRLAQPRPAAQEVH